MSAFIANHLFLCGMFAVLLTLLFGVEWKIQLQRMMSVTPAEAVQWMNRESALLLDVRTEADFRAGHLVSAKHFPAADWDKAARRWKQWQQKPIVLVGTTGRDCLKLAQKLKSEGFTTVKTLQGGIQGWLVAQLPTVTGERG